MAVNSAMIWWYIRSEISENNNFNHDNQGVPTCIFSQKEILYECFPIPMAYIRHHAKFEASRTTSQGRSGITPFRKALIITELFKMTKWL